MLKDRSPSNDAMLRCGVCCNSNVKLHLVMPLCVQVFLPRIIILNLFCGRRRAGDLQEFLLMLSGILSVAIVVADIDLVSGNRAHDLSRLTSKRRHLKLIRNRKVNGNTAGPPCETWTEVRNRTRGQATTGPQNLC